jgi:hypothetical protein
VSAAVGQGVRSPATLVDFVLGYRDPVRLDTFRFCLSISLLVYQAAWWLHAPEWLTSDGFHVSSRAAGAYAPVAPLLPALLLPGFGLLMFGTTLALILGWRLRWTSPLALLLVAYVTYADPLTAFTMNRLYLVCYAVLTFAPGGAYWSVDRARPASISRWPERVLQATLLIQYFTAGWCKAVHGDWLDNPYVLWTQSQGWYMTDLASWSLRHLPVGVFSWMQYAALTLELGAPVLFTVKRFRPIAYGWGVVFHMGTALIAYQLFYFSLQMVCFYVLFMDEDRLRRLHAATAAALARAGSALRRRV